MMLLSHHIMVSRQHNYIYQDTDDDKDFEAFALRQLNAKFSKFA